jgi:hypothetical protein
MYTSLTFSDKLKFLSPITSQTESFENRVLRRIFGPKREENGSWRKLYNDELHNLYYSQSIVRMIKTRGLRWAGQVAHMLQGRDHWKDLGVGGRITLRWTLGR